MRRIAVFAAVLFVLAVTLVVVVETFSGWGEFTLKNTASEPITEASIKVAGRSFAFKDVEPGAKISQTYKPSDSVIVVRVMFRSGRILEGGGPYITNGVDCQHDIIVSDAGVEIVELRSEYRRFR